MRGKKPKERKNYILRTENETLVEVTREVYLEWYQSRRREKYQQEQKQKHADHLAHGKKRKPLNNL